MNPQQAWKAKLEGALFLGVHNCKKTVCPEIVLDMKTTNCEPAQKIIVVLNKIEEKQASIL